MASNYNPKIVTDGLVLCLDAADKNSYPGEPTTNLAPYPFNGDATGTETGTWGSTDGSWTPNSGSIVQMVDPFGTTRNVIEYTNHSSGHFYGQPSYLTGLSYNSVTLATGSYYVSAYFKASSAITTSNILYRKGSSGNSSMGDVTLTTEWTRIGRTFEATTAGSHYFRHYSYSVPSNWNLWVTGLQIEAKSHATPFVNGTRSATDGWKDLTGNGNHGDLTNMTFDSDGQMDFNGSDDYISVADDSTLNFGSGDFTISVWFSNTGDGTYNCLYGDYSAGDKWIQITDGDDVRAGFRDSSGNENDYISTYEVTDGVIYNVMLLRDGNNNHLYVNGALVNTKTVAGVGDTDSGTNKSIGSLATTTNNHKGNIYCVQIYNRSLSAKEISQNFNAQRSRFGV